MHIRVHRLHDGQREKLDRRDESSQCAGLNEIYFGNFLCKKSALKFECTF